jgi:hypothetical protein
LPGSKFCRFHDPSTAKQVQAARVQGGRTSRRRPIVNPPRSFQLDTRDDLAAVVKFTLDRLLAGPINHHVAHAVVSLVAARASMMEWDKVEDDLAKLKEDLSQRRLASPFANPAACPPAIPDVRQIGDTTVPSAAAAAADLSSDPTGKGVARTPGPTSFFAQYFAEMAPSRVVLEDE